jgi:hypothetical protein
MYMEALIGVSLPDQKMPGRQDWMRRFPKSKQAGASVAFLASVPRPPPFRPLLRHKEKPGIEPGFSSPASVDY